jgi:hypothetical protein
MVVSAEDNARLETESESVQNFVDAEAADPNCKLPTPAKAATWQPALPAPGMLQPEL